MLVDTVTGPLTYWYIHPESSLQYYTESMLSYNNAKIYMTKNNEHDIDDFEQNNKTSNCDEELEETE